MIGEHFLLNTLNIAEEGGKKMGKREEEDGMDEAAIMAWMSYQARLPLQRMCTASCDEAACEGA